MNDFKKNTENAFADCRKKILKEIENLVNPGGKVNLQNKEIKLDTAGGHREYVTAKHLQKTNKGTMLVFQYPEYNEETCNWMPEELSETEGISQIEMLTLDELYDLCLIITENQ